MDRVGTSAGQAGQLELKALPGSSDGCGLAGSLTAERGVGGEVEARKDELDALGEARQQGSGSGGGLDRQRGGSWRGPVRRSDVFLCGDAVQRLELLVPGHGLLDMLSCHCGRVAGAALEHGGYGHGSLAVAGVMQHPAGIKRLISGLKEQGKARKAALG